MAYVDLQPTSKYPSVVIDTKDIVYAKTLTNGSIHSLLVRLRVQENIFEIKYSSQQERDAMYDKLVKALV